jgi:dihydropteroate synthase
MLLGRRTMIMGIVNLTFDSFSGDGLLSNKRISPQQILDHVHHMIASGADMIDIGGESTRPGSRAISVKEEIKRVIPVVQLLAKNITVPVSIDTYKPDVARQALDHGADIINTIQGASIIKKLIMMIKEYKAGVILMHMRKKPQTMQQHIIYQPNVVTCLISQLKKSIEKCLEYGINSDKIIIDPGIGFGKTIDHNLEIIRRLSLFHRLKKPLLIGTSRKSFIGNILNKNADQRLIGTIASVCAAVHQGAHIVRVHDVAEIKEAVQLTDAILKSD